MSGQHTIDPLSAHSVAEKRAQLVDDGFCVIPGVLRGEFLERVRRFSDSFLDTHSVDQRFRYQGSDFHVVTEEQWERGGRKQMHHDPIVDELVSLAAQTEAAKVLGLEGLQSDESIIILDKPAQGPALYWHQDGMEWNHPKFALPWPTRIFLSYYLVDTTRENGCLRAIPGSHLRRLPIHDLFPPAHGEEIQAVDESHPAFMEHPDEVDIPVAAGDLVIADTRVLHAAWPNTTERRRTLILQWWNVFPFPSMPSWWDRERPPELDELPPEPYEITRVPGKYLRP